MRGKRLAGPHTTTKRLLRFDAFIITVVVCTDALRAYFECANTRCRLVSAGSLYDSVVGGELRVRHARPVCLTLNTLFIILVAFFGTRVCTMWS